MENCTSTVNLCRVVRRVTSTGNGCPVDLVCVAGKWVIRLDVRRDSSRLVQRRRRIEAWECDNRDGGRIAGRSRGGSGFGPSL